jgi:hypothetical protein
MAKLIKALKLESTTFWTSEQQLNKLIITGDPHGVIYIAPRTVQKLIIARNNY